LLWAKLGVPHFFEEQRGVCRETQMRTVVVAADNPAESELLAPFFDAQGGFAADYSALSLLHNRSL